ncbi:HAD hydrolase family protein [Deinococcus cellulosilyticus]|uniref:Hydrolase n=1 Tax=Deinococcus cellulosilyticus (strain DSM 18568 / NBRC 106333 / KACC 11606 / 5516J-15) TaxID=1223518 RepID=A0A511N1V0_DEIC1|nr:HAD family hydrolase [Deinococcus cellulosilyticus]GEM46356.1 hydrolase [Deinococcus cellulosilyticus NBRC 106333 = KACC 11606]
MPLLAFDLDGTLIDESTKTHAPQLAEQLKTLRQQECKIALITGRFVLPPQILDLVQPDAWALGNGNRIFVADRCVSRHFLSEIEVQTALDLLGDLKLTVVGSAITDRPVNFVFDCDDPRWDPGRPGGHILPLTDMADHDVLHVMFMGEDAPIMRERLLSALPDLNVTGGIPPYTDCVNLYARQAKKHLTLQTIAELLQVSMDETIAFGDSDNDLEMLQAAGHAVQVGDMPYLNGICQDQVSCPLVGLPEWLDRFVAQGFQLKR